MFWCGAQGLFSAGGLLGDAECRGEADTRPSPSPFAFLPPPLRLGLSESLWMDRQTYECLAGSHGEAGPLSRL